VAPSRRLLAAIRYTPDLLKLSTSLTLEMDATSFWTSIQGFGHGHHWEVAPESTLPYLLWQMLTGNSVPQQTGRGRRSLGPHEYGFSGGYPPDASRSISPGAYLRSLRGPLEFALLASDDPLPGLLDLPLFAFKHLYAGYQGLRRGVFTLKR